MALLELTPKVLWFPPPHDKTIVSVIFFKNITSGPVSYKIKLTAPKTYTVKPAMGILEPSQEVEVFFTLEGTKAMPNPSEDKFQVLSAVLTDVTSAYESPEFLRSSWKHLDENQIHKLKLKASYVPEPQPILDTDPTQPPPQDSASDYSKLKQSFEEAKQNLLVTMKQKEEAHNEIQKLRTQVEKKELELSQYRQQSTNEPTSNSHLIKLQKQRHGIFIPTPEWSNPNYFVFAIITLFIGLFLGAIKVWA